MIDSTKIPQVSAIGNLVLPEQNIHTLPSGASLGIIGGGVEDVFVLSLIFTGGEAEAPSGAASRLLAMAMAEGTATRSSDDISYVMEMHGARLGAISSSHHTVVCLAGLGAMKDGVLDVLRDVLLDARYPEENVSVYRENAIMNYMQAQSRVSDLANWGLAPMMMGADNRLAYEPSPADFEAADCNTLRSMLRRIVSASSCKALLCGSVDDDLADGAMRLLSQLPAASGCHIKKMPYAPQLPECIKRNVEGAVQSAIAIGFPGPLRSHPDYLPLRIAVTALGGYFGSRLMKNIREDKGYTYGIHASLLGTADGSYAAITAQADPAYVDALIDETRTELHKLATLPMDGAEMERLRQYLSGLLAQTIDGPFAISDYYRTKELVGLPDDYFSRQVELVSSMDADMVMSMAAKYLQPEAMRISIAGPGA